MPDFNPEIGQRLLLIKPSRFPQLFPLSYKSELILLGFLSFAVGPSLVPAILLSYIFELLYKDIHAAFANQEDMDKQLWLY